MNVSVVSATSRPPLSDCRRAPAIGKLDELGDLLVLMLLLVDRIAIA
jgi:hypothetical protein